MNEIHLSAEDQKQLGGMEKMVHTYDDYMRKVTFGRERILRETTVKLAGIKPGDSVLEVGCGTGSLTLAAKHKVGPTGKVFGIDIIPGMIEVSKRKAEQNNEQITFQLGSINQIPFPDSQFDVVMCSFMIFHMSEETRQKGISEIWRVLKPGGHVLFLDMAMPSQPFQRFIAQKFLGFSQLPELRDLYPTLSTNNFTEIEYGISDFKIVILSLIGYVRATAKKN